MSNKDKSEVIVQPTAKDLRGIVEDIMTDLAPGSFTGQTVLIKPNMVGPSAPELGHTTHPDLVRAVVLSCLDRGARVMVGDNPGGMSRNSRNVAEITGILDASEGCFTPISERVVEKTGIDTKLRFIISKAVLEADVIINLPKFKTHLLMMATGAIKNVYGYVAGAGKARLHLDAPDPSVFAKVVCDIYQMRPPDLNIMDAITVIEGNGPCHGGRMRTVEKLLASTDALALDGTMAKMMGADPEKLPILREGRIRGLGNWEDEKIEIRGDADPIPDFRMPVTYLTQSLGDEELNDLIKLYPPGMMLSRTGVRPIQNDEKCILCGECAENCPAEALTLEPEFTISDACITCFCCVELCPEGALEVPDVEAFQHY
jgi:uncharacterized protein (DUF362 family)/NAD-dependent dihydropyrimidine dehydrogenase PreA subunit